MPPLDFEDRTVRVCQEKRWGAFSVTPRMRSVCPGSKAFRITSGKGPGRGGWDTGLLGREGTGEGSAAHTKGFGRWHKATGHF